MQHTPRPDQDRAGKAQAKRLLLRSRRTSRFMTTVDKGCCKAISALYACLYANSTASPLPTAEPGIASSGDWQDSLVPCPLFLSRLVLVWCWIPAFPVLVKTLSKEEMSRSNLNPPTAVTVTRLSIHLSARAARRELPGDILDFYYHHYCLHTTAESSSALPSSTSRWRCRTLVCSCLFFRRPPVVGLPRSHDLFF
jgi:hypothetical protein